MRLHQLLIVLIILSCFSTTLGNTKKEDLILANNAPPAVGKTILRQYPGAEIREVERESWEGKPAWEVELTTVEGKELEVFVSESGEILDVSEGLPLIGGELALGFGTFWEKSPYKGVDYEVDPVPIIQYRNGPFQIVTEDGVEFHYHLFGNDKFACGPLASFLIGEGFEEDDSDDLLGMDEPDGTTFHGGLFCNFETLYGNIELKFHNELLNEHSGQQVELSLEREWEVGIFEIEPSISAQYQSSDWTNYNYGVSRIESRPGRPYYNPGSALNLSAELMVQYELSPEIELIGMVECTQLDSCIDDSPIVEKDLIFELFFGIVYSF
jgi:outer membrane protein